MAQRRTLQEVPRSDVAVALTYDKDNTATSTVLAKDYDEVAQRIKVIAAEHDISMAENFELVRALAREVEIGKPTNPKWFNAVADFFAAVYRLRKGAA